MSLRELRAGSIHSSENGAKMIFAHRQRVIRLVVQDTALAQLAISVCLLQLKVEQRDRVIRDGGCVLGLVRVAHRGVLHLALQVLVRLVHGTLHQAALLRAGSAASRLRDLGHQRVRSLRRLTGHNLLLVLGGALRGRNLRQLDV